MGAKEKRKSLPIPTWVLWAVGGLLGGGLIVWGSLNTFEDSPWVSGILANLGVTVLLIVPAAYVGHRFSDWVGQVHERTDEATRQAENAKQDAAKAQTDVDMLADSVKTDLKSIREQLMADQAVESEREHSLYADLAERGDRSSLIRVLRAGQQSGLISQKGVRSPVWETDLHFRFILSDDGTALTVNFEWDNGTVAASHAWLADVDALVFYKELWRSVQRLGEYLGTGLFDPTESLERLSEALEYASRYRAQKLRMGSGNVVNIVEVIDGWYITDAGMFEKNHVHYFIAAERLWEMDWEEHIIGKRWDDTNIVSAIAVARALHSDKRPPKKVAVASKEP